MIRETSIVLNAQEINLISHALSEQIKRVQANHDVRPSIRAIEMADLKSIQDRLREAARATAFEKGKW